MFLYGCTLDNYNNDRCGRRAGAKLWATSSVNKCLDECLSWAKRHKEVIAGGALSLRCENQSYVSYSERMSLIQF